MEKKFGIVLFWEAIIILILGLIGSFVIANQKTEKLEFKKAEYSFEEDKLVTTTKSNFNGGLCLASIVGTIILSSSLYAGSVCYEKIIENNELLLESKKQAMEDKFKTEKERGG